MADVDASDFALGVNAAIRALRGIYGGVRTMLSELAIELEQTPGALYDLRVRPKPVTTRINPDERFLRSWEGRFYSAEPTDDERDDDDEDANDDEDADDEGRGRRNVTLVAGQNIAFAKVVIYHRESDAGEPHLLCGVLRDCRIPAGDQSLTVPRSSFRRILEVVRQDSKPGKLVTRASVRRPPNVPKKNRDDYKLVFRLDEAPTRYRLFDLTGRDKIREISSGIKALTGRE